MAILVESFKRVDLVEVSGRIDSSNASELDETLKQLADQDRHQLILNLSRVEYMSSAGLRAIVSALRTAKKSNGDVRMSQPSERVKEVLDLAGLTSLFQYYDDDTSAVGSF
ncbi:MAG: STAS domain-containing protein [Chloroflexi bacterium]|nr:STAS domain-containing protein [Chloroflexota bacterium]MBP8057140.1 STAS domain-containing protein [Chloroflexota bacterium]